MPVEVIPVDVVDVNSGESSGSGQSETQTLHPESSGSGQSETQAPNPATTMSTSGAYTTDFQTLTEDSVGQLYAYYYTDTSVVLGTRSAVYSANVEMAVGLSVMFDEVYICEAENFPERNDSGINIINVTIKAITRKMFNPRRACAARVTVVVLCVRLFVRPSLSVTTFSATVRNKAANKRYQRVRRNTGLISKIQNFAKILCSKVMT